MKGGFRTLFIWIVFIGILYAIFTGAQPGEAAMHQYSYTQFMDKVKADDIATAKIQGKEVSGKDKEKRTYKTYLPVDDQTLMGTLLKHKVEVTGLPPKEPSILVQILVNSVPILLLVALWIYFMRQMQGGGKGGPMSFGRSRARMLGEDQVKVGFADVAGCEEAKEEVSELVDFLRDPSKFQKLGGKIPRGVLLVGQPGTGKTLLAKAVAGEAKVPFFTISGSDFVEMFVGVGASRVRDMFEQAKKQAPCIIFIDEIDAVGRRRGAGLGGGHDEREQTLNQMLVEMDGFSGNEGVIVVAATNRPDVLDPALLRPGRFDRQVVVPLPDIIGREEILKVHMRKVPLEETVEPSVIARGTPGFSGADLANLVNEAALFAARSDKTMVSMVELEKAKDKIMMGAERRSMRMDEDEKKLTAYHEAGHAIVGLSIESHDPVYKVTIIPRGRALGVTMFLPERDRYSHSRERLLAQLCSLYGGRIAEEMIFGADKVTTGASNDIERATEMARNMVMKWGLSEKLGPLCYDNNQEEVFLGNSVSRSQNVSEATAEAIDQEVRRILDACYQRAETILKKENKKLHAMAEALMKYETIDTVQLDEIMGDKPVSEPRGWKEEQAARKKAHEEARTTDMMNQLAQGTAADKPADGEPAANDSPDDKSA